MGLIADAEELASKLLGGMRTRLGGLHIEHARRVAAEASLGGDDQVTAAALLHDVVEKAGISPDELFAWVGDARVMDLVRILTRDDDEEELTYLARCAADPVAYYLKRLDLVDKLERHDEELPEDEACHLRDEARERLAQLDDLHRRVRR